MNERIARELARKSSSDKLKVAEYLRLKEQLIEAGLLDESGKPVVIK